METIRPAVTTAIRESYAVACTTACARIGRPLDSDETTVASLSDSGEIETTCSVAWGGRRTGCARLKICAGV